MPIGMGSDRPIGLLFYLLINLKMDDFLYEMILDCVGDEDEAMAIYEDLSQ